MPLAIVDKFGSQCYYEDTSAPPGSSDYTTLVLIHGAGFPGTIFERLLTRAAKHNMRLVAVNMRDYSRSTPYSQSELDDLRSTNSERQAAAVRARGLEIVTFLLWYIRKENIPPLSSGAQEGSIRRGGISLSGWSWGCKMALSCVARAQELQPDDREFLAGYMRALVLFDPSPRVFGAPMAPIEEHYNPFYDASMTPEAKKDYFPGWVSGYYSHSAAVLDDLPSHSYAELCAGLTGEPMAYPSHQTPTLHRMSPEELARVVNEDVIARSHIFYELLDSTVYTDSMHLALHDASVWPQLRVLLLWCDMSVSGTVVPSWGFLKAYQEDWPANGRRVDAVRIKGANHFPHWDYPDRTMQLLAEIIWSADRDPEVKMMADVSI
ncbi:Alpha/Beta hydrolase protein [Rhodofomes roseus]|uniref:Alpha/Beta hydrolase protein n=1 Tax=Rhodofomes roseus TaxID=34475 RepID=A0ABQ8K1Z3_9APHY|nr:Alpha/Beta hydrolase protein [Rhodofomes roseus]KAH9830743.1 Alpha/Beta hydrolase protein [Rhodofomes roseus]